MKKKNVLTDRQKEIYNFILRYKRKNETVPSYREIAVHFNVSDSSIHTTVKRIEEAGFIKRDRRPRMYKIV